MRKFMRYYLGVIAVLGFAVACSSGTGDGDAGTDPADSGAAGTAGTLGTALGGAGMSSGGGGGASATGGSNASAGSGSAVAGSSGVTGGMAAAGGATGGMAAAGAGGTGSGGTSGGGKAGSGNAGGGNAGAAGGPSTKTTPDFKFPTAVGPDQKLSASKEVTDFDGKMARYVGTGALGSGGQNEGQDPLFLVKAGGSLKNVILGAPAADGVHCEGSCTIENVWWEDVGEDAITLLGSSSSNVYRITGGGARKATDKVIQHNGAGTLYVKNFLVEEFGKLYRSCGNCSKQYTRHAEFDTILANGSKSILAGVNQNYKDTAKFSNIFAATGMKICERYDGNDTGAEPNSLGNGADGTYCIYSNTDVTWH